MPPAPAKDLISLTRACPTNTEYHVFVGNFVANFVENGRKPTKFPTKFWENGFLGQALALANFASYPRPSAVSNFPFFSGSQSSSRERFRAASSTHSPDGGAYGRNV